MTVVKFLKKLYSANDHSKYKLSQDTTVRKWQTKIQGKREMNINSSHKNTNG